MPLALLNYPLSEETPPADPSPALAGGPPRASARHCPFLNREDDRCAPQFSVGHLDHVFDRCCGDYAGCDAYREQLAERAAARLRPDPSV